MIAAGCDPVITVVPEDAMALAAAALGAEASLISGGSTRMESVRKGLAFVDSELVIVHDGARPLVTTQLVRRVLAALDDADAAIAAVPVDETIKRVDDETVQATVDRQDLWVAQTPQGFRTSILKFAHDQAERDQVSCTDDAQLVERYGTPVKIVTGDRTNLKLTWSGDFEVAQALLAARNNAQVSP